jgi:hypothetical protein
MSQRQQDRSTVSDRRGADGGRCDCVRGCALLRRVICGPTEPHEYWAEGLPLLRRAVVASLL